MISPTVIKITCHFQISVLIKKLETFLQYLILSPIFTDFKLLICLITVTDNLVYTVYDDFFVFAKVQLN